MENQETRPNEKSIWMVDGGYINVSNYNFDTQQNSGVARFDLDWVAWPIQQYLIVEQPYVSNDILSTGSGINFRELNTWFSRILAVEFDVTVRRISPLENLDEAYPAFYGIFDSGYINPAAPHDGDYIVHVSYKNADGVWSVYRVSVSRPTAIALCIWQPPLTVPGDKFFEFMGSMNSSQRRLYFDWLVKHRTPWNEEEWFDEDRLFFSLRLSQGDGFMFESHAILSKLRGTREHHTDSYRYASRATQIFRTAEQLPADVSMESAAANLLQYTGMPIYNTWSFRPNNTTTGYWMEDTISKLNEAWQDGYNALLTMQEVVFDVYPESEDRDEILRTLYDFALEHPGARVFLRLPGYVELPPTPEMNFPE